MRFEFRRTLSWSWISRLFEKKILDEMSKQLNLEISKDGKISFKQVRRCKFCRAIISKEEIFCPKCRRSLA